MFVVQLAYLAFFSIALPDSMLGVAWPSMRLSFDQPLSAAGLVPPVGVAAAVVSTIAAPYLTARWGVGRLLAAGTALSAAALAGSALTPTWWGFLVTVALGGLASGAIDATLNAFAARRFGPQQINLLHACYGVGAVVSPLLVTVALATGAGWRAAFGVVAGLMFVIAVVFTVARHGWDDGVPAAASPAATSEGRVWSLPATLGLVTVVLARRPPPGRPLARGSGSCRPRSPRTTPARSAWPNDSAPGPCWASLPGLLGLALDHDARWFALGLALLSLLIAGLLRLIGRRAGTAPQVPEGQ
ncbi:MFS transporter [Micropruina glycogenica]|uniref:Major facilitator superfamily (MFS) profile domain-containing protein n=1 Tax=Micropruina glycogenica TaxID=75385 RepID=A0A2N9JBS4_9ACTN|nr:MFS transporter [Micropruina glycogenica]SPD85587.1 membrane protein of unknown function [Micropruina glycogenica]